MKKLTLLISESRARARCLNEASSCEFLAIKEAAESCNSLLCSTILETSYDTFLSDELLLLLFVLSPPLTVAVELKAFEREREVG
ncbi:hypothetical protein Hanom_Chr01g00029641 [Helianthus anomalus]